MVKIGVVATGKRCFGYWTQIEQLLKQRIPTAKVSFHGALDDYTSEQIEEISRERTGRAGGDEINTCIIEKDAVLILKSALFEPMQKAIDRFNNEDVDILFINSGSEYPRFKTRKPLLTTYDTLYSVAEAIMKHQENPKLGIIVSDPEHLESSENSWRSPKWELHAEIGKIGYSSTMRELYYFPQDRLIEVANNFRKAEVNLIAFCAWASFQKDKDLVHEISGIPVLTGPSLCPTVIKELEVINEK
jgi:hypothetical protein